MKGLLAQLDGETFVLDLSPYPTEISLNDVGYRIIDDHTLEIDLQKPQNLNNVFAQLSAQQVEVLSMRNKSNRLEALFVNLIENNDANKKAK